jgi:prepilin-type N-terminal cleavage/methylation domain-containing protein
MSKLTKRTSKYSSGFTLVEVLVSVALFVIVVTTAVSALLVILDANRKAQSISNTINNTFFTYETMSRLMRTGLNYHCGSGGQITEPNDCPNGDDEIYFTDDRGQFVHIWLDRSSGNGVVMQEVDPNGAGNGVSFGPEYELTAADFDVQTLRFIVTGSTVASDTEQPMTTIILHGVANAGTPESSELKLQTTVTQRMIDL